MNRDRRTLSSEKAPQNDKYLAVQAEIKMCQKAPDGVRRQDGQTDRPTVGRNVTLTPVNMYVLNVGITTDIHTVERCKGRIKMSSEQYELVPQL